MYIITAITLILCAFSTAIILTSFLIKFISDVRQELSDNIIEEKDNHNDKKQKDNE